MPNSVSIELPPHLAERTRIVSAGSAKTERTASLFEIELPPAAVGNPAWRLTLPAHAGAGVDGSSTDSRPVVYWMRNAMRAHENPALDTAVEIAAQLDLPLLVYQGLSPHYRYASDRHHTFILQGARDVQTECRELGISYAFYLSTDRDSPKRLLELGQSAAVIVTEDMPVDPPRRFLKRLRSETLSTQTPIIAVDTSCVVPMQLIGKPITRAFQFRSATKKLYLERLTRAWPASSCRARPFELARLPSERLDLKTADLPALVASCEIDHAVGPVVDTIGGSTAGYARWEQFRTKQLARYAKQRNNALLDGVSRMSAYLHYGMVSPFRIARQAAEYRNAGAEKFLDELLIWRELAYAFCFYREDHDQWSALPEWAQATLKQHSIDARPELYSWESLARGRTNDPFWNAAQRSLLVNGELHNNVRMTWGKAILNWADDPRRALELIIDLNHRYALDGRDPASYGGILWCLGQFDRPFEPEQPILGTVRPRPTHSHAERLDVSEFEAKVASPRVDPIPEVAIIGAGLSGLFAARTLADHGLAVTVFDKGRGVGGRMSTRQTAGSSFDHGAQYFTTRDSRFARYVESWQAMGLVAAWPAAELGADQKIVVLKNGRIDSESNSVQRYVAVPGMNAIAKHLADGIAVRTETRVDQVKSIKYSSGSASDNPTAGADGGRPRVELWGDDGASLGCFDHAIVTAPAEQAAELLVDFPQLSGPIKRIPMNPCWAALVTLDRPVTDQWVGAFIHDSLLSWVARNNTKPGRPSSPEHLVLHANPQWTLENWERPASEVAADMLTEFFRIAGSDSQVPLAIQGHRWKFAIPREPASDLVFFDAEAGIAAGGDWATGGRVEGAFLSGMAAAGRVLGTLRASTTSTRQQQTLF